MKSAGYFAGFGRSLSSFIVLSQIFTLTLTPVLASQQTQIKKTSAKTVVSKPAAKFAVKFAGQDIFKVISQKSAEEIQNRLDNALVATSNPGPSSIKITYVKGLPVLTLGGYYILTVDNDLAKSAGNTPSVLASNWSKSLKTALANESSTKAYIAHLSGIDDFVYPVSNASGNNSLESLSSAPTTAPDFQNEASESNIAQVSYNGNNAQASYRGWMPMPTTDNPAYASSGNLKQARVVYIPAGMLFTAKLDHSISTSAAKAGDLVSASIKEPINLGDTIIPANSVLTGQVVDTSSGSYLSKSGKLAIKFNSIRTPDGTMTPISAHLVGGIGKYDLQGTQSDTIKGEALSGRIKRTLLTSALGAGSGAALGTAVGAIAGGKHGIAKGAWSSTAIGAGLGLASSMLLKGKDINLSQGNEFKVQLDAPISIAMSQ